MKLSGVMTGLCMVLLLVFTSASAVQNLKTINDLRAIQFGQSVPSHSLLLLYWFANTVDIDNNNIIRLTFDPSQGDYGSHHYGNYERLLEPLPQGNIQYRYYTIGNLNQEMSSELPSYIVHPRFGYEGRNMDRIIFRVREQNVGRQTREIVDRVYITQHFETSANQGTRYNPEHTYQVTTRLLRRIREFSVEQIDINSLMNLRDRLESTADGAQLAYIMNYWGELACLGLFLFMVIQEKSSSNQHKTRRQSSTRSSTQSDHVVNIPGSRAQPSTRSSTQSDHVVNIPGSRAQPSTRSSTQSDHVVNIPGSRRQPSTRSSTQSDYVVNIPGSRRQPSTRSSTQSDYIVNIPGSRAQPSTRRSTHSDYVVKFPSSRQHAFSGMFASVQDQSNDITLQVATGSSGKARILWRNVPGNLLEEGVMVTLYRDDIGEDALTYKSIGSKRSGSYDTSVPMNEGLQVRLHTVKRLCCFWRCIGEEVLRGDEFKNPPAVSIKGYNAHLQLFTKNGKACARLYVKNSFYDWKSTFNNSWVGFYSSENKATKDYAWCQWQWATNFKPLTELYNSSEYELFEYHSGMTIAPGVQARFILRDEVEKARTPSWRE